MSPPDHPSRGKPQAHDERVEALFNDALELPPGQREAFVHQATREEPAVRDEAISLLAAHRRAGAFLSGHAIEESIRSGALTDPMIDRTLGRYRIIDRIGTGGMGSVYLAERADETYHQRVAVKLISRDATSDEMLRRFHNERQVLATLNHPNIAALLDGGTTEPPDTQPYLVMEFVDGTRLDQYADHHALTIPQRLELFLTICHAVQAAHRNLVVHRDLKPANILVTDEGTVKLLDFGIAKVLQADGARPNQALSPGDVTATIERRMTPAYASPEQLRGLTITTATDVYSLGVILYELLTGHRPHRIDGTSIDQATRVICEQPVPRPSTAVLQPIEGTHAIHPETGKPSTITPEQNAARRGTDPMRLHRVLRGDLENIILMALRKEPERRYASVEQLAEDLTRYRRRLPVIARPDTLGYRFTRFAQRNAIAVSATAAGIALLITTTVIIAIALARAIDAERLAEARLADSLQAQAGEAAERSHAEQQRRIAEAINEFLINDLLLAVSPNEAHPAGVTVVEVIDRAASVIDQRFTELPAVEAQLRATLGNAYRILGQFEQADPLLHRAVQLMESELGVAHPDTIENRTRYAIMQYEAGRLEHAETAIQSAYEAAREHLGPEALLTLEPHSALCSLLMELQRFDEAAPTCLKLLETARTAHGDDAPITQLALNYAARLHLELGQLDHAEAIYRDLLESRRRTDGHDAVRTQSALNNLAVLYIRMERFADAEPLLHEALLHYRHAFGETHGRTLTVQGNLARSIFEQGRHDEAEPILRETVANLLEQLGDSHWIPAAYMSIHGSALAALKRFEEAEAALTQSHDTILNTLGPTHDRTRAIEARITDLYTTWLEHTPSEEIAARANAWQTTLPTPQPSND